MSRMNKYVKREDVVKFFDFDPVKNKSICLIPGCGQKLSGKLLSNMKRHIFLRHETVSKQINLIGSNIVITKTSTEPPHSFEDSSNSNTSCASAHSAIFNSSGQPAIKKRKLDETRFVKGCIKCCTEESVPFRFFNSDAFRMVTEGITDALGITINAAIMLEKVNNAADKIRSYISKELDQKIVSIKVDAATKLDRSLLGINAQFLRDGAMQIRTLGVIELTQSRTGVSIKAKLDSLLENYGVSHLQVYSITTDNGANMVKAVKLLENDQTNKLEEMDFDFEEISDSNNKFYVDVANELEGDTQPPVLSCIRCVAHVLQLVVSDVGKACHSQLKDVRVFVKHMKNVKYRERYALTGTPRPILDIVTRWMSTYLMMKNLLDNLAFFNELSSDNSIDCELSATTQEFVINYVKAFTPLFFATKRFQEEQLIMGDFFKFWIQCIMECQEIAEEYPNNNFAMKILNSMKQRQVKLFENRFFLAAIYMDPRFNNSGSNVLNPEQKKIAIDQIFNTWLLMKRDSPRDIGENPSQAQEMEPSSSKLEEFYRQMFSQQKYHRIDQSDDDVKQQILNLCKQAQLPLSGNVLKHWELRRFDDTIMYQLSQIILAVPPTQVSMERAFSALGLVLTSQQSRLAEHTINNLLVCKLNPDVFDKIQIN